MKNSILSVATLCTLTFATIFFGCSSMGHNESGKDFAATGPTIVNPRSAPSTIEMNAALQPTQNPDIVADVKDFTGKVSDVKIQFVSIPLEVPMQNIGGSTWQATLTPQQLQMLAVSGKTIKYDVNVIAKDDKGIVAQTKKPFEVAIKAPDLARSAG